MASSNTAINLPIFDAIPFHGHFEHGLTAAEKISTLQINIGYVCNLACRHCHVESSPARTAPDENMSEATAQKILQWVKDNPSIRTVDITGGSPEMNPNFRWLVPALRALGICVIDRCNPTIIQHIDKTTGTNFEWVPAFLAENQVHVVASLPCYLEDNVDKQRGKGSYSASVQGLLKLNAVGYGTDPNLPLNLVYNPTGPQLPPPQASLQADYKHELMDRFGLRFNNLWTITNMPIKRWRHDLERNDGLTGYMQLLTDAYNPDSIEGLMCRHQISIDPQGNLYDCDFNQALSLTVPNSAGKKLWDYNAQELANRVIATGDHCYGCTAGAGSSCGGAII